MAAKKYKFNFFFFLSLSAALCALCGEMNLISLRALRVSVVETVFFPRRKKADPGKVGFEWG